MAEDIETLLQRLQAISPMPPDWEATDEQLQEYKYIIHALWELKDARCVRPLIESFGYPDGYELNWTALHLLEQFWPEVEPILPSYLQHPNPGTRMWSVMMLQRSRNQTVVPNLIMLLQDPNEYVRAEAASALGVIMGKSAREYLLPLQEDESAEVRSAVKWIFKMFDEGGADSDTI
jgi:HEAT repeat protein